jgi:hypothetical protein
MTSPLESNALNDEACASKSTLLICLRKQINAEEPSAIIKQRHATKVGELIKVMLTAINALEGVEKYMEAEAAAGAAGVKPKLCLSFIVARELFEGIWLSSVQLPQTVQQLTQAPLVIYPCVERTTVTVQLPPCIAGRITAVIGSTQLTLEDLSFDGIPDFAVSALSDLLLVTYLCQRRAILSLQ